MCIGGEGLLLIWVRAVWVEGLQGERFAALEPRPPGTALVRSQ